MKKLFIFTVVLVGAVWGVMQITKDRKPLGSVNNSPIMQISSNAFANDSLIPDTYTCNGEGVNPPLQFSGISPDAQSLALTITDPTAPGGTYVHWVIYNLSTKTSRILENSKPAGIFAKNSSGLKDYVALCPPSGEHRYVFTLYALDSYLPNDSILNNGDLLAAMRGHILDQAQLFGRFSKK